MFIGHFALGLGAKSIAPKLSLGTLFLAVQFLDLLWPTLLLLGIEQVIIEPGATLVTPLNFIHYPYSHSLMMVIGWAALLGIIYFIVKKNVKYALVIALCIISHWFLDLLVHRADLPLYPGESPLYGFALWNSLALTALLEGSLFIVGLVMYLRISRAKNRRGFIGFWLLVVLLIIIYLLNLFSPPPPSTDVIAWVGQLQWLFVIWAYWLDNNRELKLI